MKFEDKAGFNGYLTVYKLYPDGKRDYILKDDPNVITYESRRRHLQYLWDYDNIAKDNIVAFRVGDGGAVGDDTQGNANVKVIAPDPTANDLYNHIAIGVDDIDIAPSDPVEFPEQVSLRVRFTLPQDAANGYKINECGLFKESGDMFNHKTFISIEKSEAFSIIFDWNIRYV